MIDLRYASFVAISAASFQSLIMSRLCVWFMVRGRGTGGGGAMRACKKVLFFWAKVPHLKNEKSIS